MDKHCRWQPRLIDNDGYPSADRVLEEYQHSEVGDWVFPMNGLFGIRFPVNETTAFKVKAFETNKWLLWEKPDSTWTWLLRPLPGGRTRLISRQKARYREPLSMVLMEFGDPPMMRRVLKGIKARAGSRAGLNGVWNDPGRFERTASCSPVSPRTSATDDRTIASGVFSGAGSSRLIGPSGLTTRG